LNRQSREDNYILGIFCLFHDSSACLLRNGKLVAMAEEERFNRQKHTYKIPLNAIEYCLRKAGIEFSELNAVAYGFRPRKFLFNQLFSAMRNLPGSLNLLRAGASYMPLGEKLDQMFNLEKHLSKHFNVEPPEIHYIDHHTAHAYSSYFVSPFDSSAILVLDAFGETYATSFGKGEADGISFFHHVPFPNSLGVYYGAVTQYLGFRTHSDEYKVMGMAAYGKDEYLDVFRNVIADDGDLNFRLDTSYISLYTHGIAKWFSERMVEALGPNRSYEDPYAQKHFDIAKSAQTQLEDVVVSMGKNLRKITGSKNLCLAGGVAQNVLMNRRLLNDCGFENIYVPPVAYDGGVSLGSALAVYHRCFSGKRMFVLDRADWGPSYSDDECLKALIAKGLSVKRSGDITEYLANTLAEGKVVGYFDGGMEIGPRALGYRSILADPRRPDMKDTLNARVKKREFFRPFSPMVTLESCPEYFDLQVESPFMAITSMVKKPELIPATTHNDGTARIQTVTRACNPHIYDLLQQFSKISGVPVLLNTSFNENEPIVCTPGEAVECFLRTHMDVLVYNNTILVEK
jgi:carbamoyltransferase